MVTVEDNNQTINITYQKKPVISPNQPDSNEHQNHSSTNKPVVNYVQRDIKPNANYQSMNNPHKLPQTGYKDSSLTAIGLASISLLGLWGLTGIRKKY